MSRLAAVLLLGAAACAHDHAFDRREVGAMKNASPAISPWNGPEVDPVALRQRDAGTEALILGSVQPPRTQEKRHDFRRARAAAVRSHSPAARLAGPWNGPARPAPGCSVPAA